MLKEFLLKNATQKIKEYAEDLFRIAVIHTGSNDWFQYGMAIWYSPQKEFLLEMIDGISKNFSLV